MKESEAIPSTTKYFKDVEDWSTSSKGVLLLRVSSSRFVGREMCVHLLLKNLTLLIMTIMHVRVMGGHGEDSQLLEGMDEVYQADQVFNGNKPLPSESFKAWCRDECT